MAVPAGLLWVVAGIWAVRSMAGGPVGAAWGIAVVGAGLRWGTLSIGDLEVATRVAGPTVLAGPIPVRIGMILALVAALAGEAQVDGLSARTWAPKAAAIAAVVVLAPLYVVSGPTDPLDLGTLCWAAFAALATTAVLLAARHRSRVPAWAPAVAAAVGVAIAVSGS